jgi:peptide-methionine (S)-S-oxide reductase
VPNEASLAETINFWIRVARRCEKPRTWQQARLSARIATTFAFCRRATYQGAMSMNEDIATFAGGCFWCVEAVFQGLSGVHKVESGYIGGHQAHPTYREVCGGATGHAEAIKVSFDPSVIAYGDLLDIFFATHDPTQLNRQGNDIGTQYRSAIFPHSEDQDVEARAAILRVQPDWPAPIVTTIEPLAIWYPAEDYHQEYWNGEGQRNPYCLALIPPKLAKLRKGFAERIRS